MDESLGTQVNGLLQKLSTELPGDSLSNLLNDSSCANEITKQVLNIDSANHPEKTANSVKETTETVSKQATFSTLTNHGGVFSCIKLSSKHSEVAQSSRLTSNTELQDGSNQSKQSPSKPTTHSPSKSPLVFVQKKQSKSNKEIKGIPYK